MSIPLLCAIPTFYEEAGQQDIALALQLGAEAVIHLKGSAMEMVRNETHSESVKHYEGEVAAVKREAAKEREKVEELLRKANQALQGQEQTLQEYREKCQKEARASMLELVAMKDKQIYELREELARSMDSMGRKFDTLHNSLVKTLSSSKEKGPSMCPSAHSARVFSWTMASKRPGGADVISRRSSAFRRSHSSRVSTNVGILTLAGHMPVASTKSASIPTTSSAQKNSRS